jgi:hypothetical protein
MAYATPRTWVAGDVLTAAQMNQDVRDNQLAAHPLGVDAWTAYTPTFAGTTLGTGSVVGAYQRVGRTIFFRAWFALGSGSAVTGPVTVTLPVTARDLAARVAAAFVVYEDGNGGNYAGWSRISSAETVMELYVIGTAGIGTNLSATSPFTWASGDIIAVTGTYEAAS